MYCVKCDVAIIGGGPAGLAAAVAAREEGAEKVLILERDSALGGILQQCIHPGFGLTRFHEELTGPEYYGRFVKQAEELGVESLLNSMVLQVDQEKREVLCTSRQYGLTCVQAGSIVLAMGGRERTRANIMVPGTRPAGLYTAGAAQRLVNRQNIMVGRRVVILGSGDIGMIMARRMTLEGAQVVMVVELMSYLAGLTRNRVQCLDDFQIPLKLSHTITRIDGGSEITMTVTDGYVYTLPELEKSGYTFTGWRVNNSNTIVKGGESYTITANTTFTAVWNMIMIPDTYDIAVDQPAHGTVDVSFSNASQGSVITVTATPDEGYELVYITVDGEPISGNSFVMPDHAVEVSALFAEIGKEVNFVDVSRADWFYDYVQYVAQNGLMEGTTRTAFEPNASMTRAMFWTVLARIDGETITGDAWKTLAQTWAVESGISDGTNADALITREQMVTMLYRYAGSPVTGGMAISEFTDGASVSDYATDAVTWALSEGILTGMGDGILAPQGTATRAQAAAMLMRFVEA